MHIAVCIKMVPDTAQVRIDPVTNVLIREGIPFITNPFDDHAIEEALRLKDRYGAKVTVLSMGPLPAQTIIKRAMARGADAGILVSDRVFGGADTLATSRTLAAAVSHLSSQEKVDLVICGKQTIDGDTAQVGPGMAVRLRFAQVTLVDKVLGVDKEQGAITVRAKFDDRYEVIRAKFPALITVVREINRLRYPTVEGRLEADEANIPLWNNEKLKLDPQRVGLNGSATWVKRIFAPVRKKGEMINGRDEFRTKAVGTVIEKLQEWKIL